MDEKTFIIDIDGTLTIESEGYGLHVYRDRSPNFQMITKVRMLYDAGHRIILWTARYFEDEAVTKDWLERFNVPYHRLHLGKPQYCVWVDDKAVHPDNFDVDKYL